MGNEKLEKLKQISLFEAIRDNKEQMNLLLDICQFQSYKSGQRIIKEGDTGELMFIVLTGGVEILKRTRAGDNYTVVALKAEHNVFFGELALVDDDTRSATVTASVDTDCLTINKTDFTDLGNKYPQIGLPITRAIVKIIAGRLRKTTQDMLTLFDALVSEIQE